MYDTPKTQKAVAAIRVSSTRQGTDGDSPEAQKEQIDRYAKSKNLKIVKFFEFLESASKETQPMQKAIDYCKNPKNLIDIFIVKSIDRFTRGGSYSYSTLKMQLDQHNVKLIDIYGIIGTQKVNTLEHLNVSYGWSVYDPTKNSELLEAERACDEKRDIMSRMIGAEIRYTRLGYWMRQAPYGYMETKILTPQGKRTVLAPHPKEAAFVVRMFELRARGTLTDNEISDELNLLGFKSRKFLVRSKVDKSRIVGERGGNAMNSKSLQKMIRRPLYAGVNDEAWVNGVPAKCRFKGLVTPELFNLANKGKVIISPDRKSITYATKNYMQKSPIKSNITTAYPYRRVVLCPYCEHTLCGSASRGKSGKYYPAYHCNSNSNIRHNFRVPKIAFDETLKSFVESLSLSHEYIDLLNTLVLQGWNKYQESYYQDLDQKYALRQETKSQLKLIAKNLCFIKTQSAVSYLEEELKNLEIELKNIEDDINRMERNAPLDADAITKLARSYTDDLFELLISEVDEIAKQQLFSLVFDELPTYDDLAQKDKNIAAIKINKLFCLDRK